MWKIIKINLIVFICILVFLELTGQFAALFRYGHFLFSNPDYKTRNSLFVPHPYLSVGLKKNVVVTSERDTQYKSVTTTALGTRETGADLNDTSLIRIACIGGSTTFCTGVGDNDTWPSLLQQKLGNRFAVINYGVPAYQTVQGIIQLALYIPEVKPDVVIIYEGVNDYYDSHLKNIYPDYYLHAETIMPMALLGTPKCESLTEKLKRVSGLYHIVSFVVKKIYPVNMVERYADPDPVVDKLYQRNIRTMLSLSEDMKAKVFMVSQVLNPHWEWEETPWSIRIQKDKILPYMDRLNQLGRAVCETDSGSTFLDFNREITWKPEHFWDEMHFTKTGSELFADSLAAAIKQSFEKHPVGDNF